MTDVIITNHGSLIGFQPVSEVAKEWFDENVESEGYQWMGPVLYVDYRLAGDLFEGVVGAGFEVQ